HFRVVNPWIVPMQQPHPPIWVPGTASPETAQWAASHGYTYVVQALKCTLSVARIAYLWHCANPGVRDVRTPRAMRSDWAGAVCNGTRDLWHNAGRNHSEEHASWQTRFAWGLLEPTCARTGPPSRTSRRC